MATIIGRRNRNYVACLTEAELSSALEPFIEAARANGGYGIDTETGGLSWQRDPLYMISAYTEGLPAIILPVGWSECKIRMSRLSHLLDPLISQDDINALFWNLKFDMHFMQNVRIKNWQNRLLDVHVMAHLVNNEAPGKLKLRAKADLGMMMNEFKKLFNLGRGKTLLDYPISEVAPYAADDAVATYRLGKLYMGANCDPTSPHFTLNGDSELGLLFQKVEIPITRTLFKMERRGVLANVQVIEEFGQKLQPKIEKSMTDIFKVAGTEFNPSSPKQLMDVLKQRGHRALQSTDEATLNIAFAETKDPMLKHLLDYRGYMKLRGTYVEGMLEAADVNHVIHTSFNQAGTETGRFSSSGPNLQNIPREGEIRAFFKPRPGYVFIVRDYGQLELRVAAHAARDAVMIDEFRRGMDIHSVSAAGIFNKDPADVTPEERQIGKSTSSFGVLFGMSPHSLALKLGVSEIKAEVFIDNWFRKYHGIDMFFKRLVESAKQTGMVRTFLGRIRHIDALLHPKSKGAMNAAIREAKNTSIQGAAADLVKLGMLACTQDEMLYRLGAHLLLQVHDELMFEVPVHNAYLADQIVADRMINFPVAKKLLVPLTTDGGIGRDWNEAKKGKLNEQYKHIYEARYA